MENIDTILQQILNARKSEGLLRTLQTDADGVDFYSNDYLGLAHSKAFKTHLLRFSKDFIQQFEASFPIGATGSRLISGNHPIHELFESRCAQFHKAEAALLFGSGFEANLGLLSAIGLENHVILCDKLLHASLIDGLRLSKAEKRIFKHNNLLDLEKILQQYPKETPKWVVVESVYSMDGDQAPLEELVNLKHIYGFELIVDEAHAGGIYGPNGEGLCVEKNIQNDIYARVVTFGKAWGHSGAVVLGNQTLKDFLVNFARPFIYSTAPSLPHVIDLLGILEYLPNCTTERQNLDKVIQFFVQQQKTSHWLKSKTAIQSYLVPGNENVRKKAKLLQEAGFLAKPIVYPTVAKGTERIRITLHAQQKETDIIKLIRLLENE